MSPTIGIPGGRLGRTGRAAASLLMSVLLRPTIRRSPPYPRADGRVVHGRGGGGDRGGRTNRPNDLLVGDRKLAGILAEATDDALVIGIGVNIDWRSTRRTRAIATACNLEGGRPSSRGNRRRSTGTALRSRRSMRLRSPARTLGRRVRWCSQPAMSCARGGARRVISCSISTTLTLDDHRRRCHPPAGGVDRSTAHGSMSRATRSVKASCEPGGDRTRRVRERSPVGAHGLHLPGGRREKRLSAAARSGGDRALDGDDIVAAASSSTNARHARRHPGARREW
jgi:hypothetical protein